MNMQIVSVSSKGQIAIPVSYRKELSLNEGSKLAIFSDGENIILKPITLPSEESLLSALADMNCKRMTVSLLSEYRGLSF